MNTSTEKFPQQDAPEKNTDRAFVQVGRDGNPVMPQTEGDDAPAEQSNAANDETER